MNEFKHFHPLVNFIYFAAVIGFGMFFMHPVCLAIGIGCSFAYSIILNGKKAVKFNILFLVPTVAIAAVFNAAFNHEGATILTYLPNDNPLTLESLAFGAASGTMLAVIVCWFSCFNKIMTSDKFIYLFGKIIPSFSLVLSMILRFVPRFKAQLKVISTAQKCIGCDMSKGNIIKRAKNGITVLSIMITWALENAIDTADSMKSRGYGLPGRTAFSIFTFNKRDFFALIYILITGAYVIAGKIKGIMDFVYFPLITDMTFSACQISVFIAYALLCAMPVITETREGLKWKHTESKISHSDTPIQTPTR